MVGPQKKSSEVIVQILYSFEMNGTGDQIIPTLMHELKMTRKTILAAYEKAEAVWQTKEKWDSMIASRSDSYDFKRIGNVEKSILRLALFDLCTEKDPDTKEIVSESLRVAKKFCGDSAGAFIHALIDSYIQGKLSGEFEEK
jgi:N utilization substance protein B